MNRLLKFHIRQSAIPNRRTPSLTTLANHNITGSQSIAFKFMILERHSLQVRRVNIEPTNIWIP